MSFYPKEQCSYAPKDEVCSPLGDFEMLKKDETFRSTALSLSVPNDYAEPLFDDEPRQTLVSDDYAVPRNDSSTIAPNQANTIASSHLDRHSESFVQPAASMNLLVAQIKDTMVKKVMPESIWYGTVMHVHVAICTHSPSLYIVFIENIVTFRDSSETQF